MGCNALFEKHCLFKGPASLVIISYRQHDMALFIKSNRDAISVNPVSITNPFL